MAAAKAAENRPNILFLMADQLRFDCLGANGNRLIRTPNLDALASESVNFTHAYVQAPVCVPSRISYFTGRYPHSHKNRVNYTPAGPQPFLQSILKDNGYQTGSVGKLHFYPPTSEHARSSGFDRVLLHDGVAATDRYSDYVRWRKAHDPRASIPETETDQRVEPGGNPYRAAIQYEYTPTHWVGEQTIAMLREFARAPKPFFLFSSFFKPHSPFQVPAPYDSMYNGVEIPLPRRVSLEEIQRLPLPVQRLILRGRPEYTIPPERLQWVYRSYYAAVSMVDYEVGRILGALSASGRSRDTIVIFAADHGAQLLEHGLMDKNVFFESSVRTPFLMRYPGRIVAQKQGSLVEMVDVLPTILELCGIPIADAVQGRSFAALATGRSAVYHPREIVFSENIIPEVITGGSVDMPFIPGQGVAGIRHPDAKMVRTSNWKLNYYSGQGLELYDMRNDPGEMRNLAGDPAYRSTVCDLEQELLDWMITADENDQIARRWLL
jgi:arylsulfatase